MWEGLSVLVDQLHEKKMWLGSSNSKSITKNAQNIIKNLHSQLTQQQEHISELHHIIELLQESYQLPIIREIQRLENLKANYYEKIHEIDQEILKQQELLNEIDEKLNKLTTKSKENKLRRGSESKPTSTGRYSKNIQSNHDIGHIVTNNQNIEEEKRRYEKLFTSLSSDYHTEIEDEHELLEAIKLIDSTALFILYRNNTDDVIVYTPSSSSPSTNSDILTVYRIRDPSDSTSKEEITSFERMMVYGPRNKLNSDRNEPDIIELPCPGLPSHKGELVGCIFLPIASDIPIDIWRCNQPASSSDPLITKSHTFPKYWATITVNEVKYAVLECLYIKSEVRWGFTTITSIEITARDPVDGRVLIEDISVS